MELKIVHFYPDLMSLYGSYANVSVLRRYLEALGCTVTVQPVRPGEGADIAGADFLFMGAGTERAQRFAAGDFVQYGPTVKALAEDGCAMLFAGLCVYFGASVDNKYASAVLLSCSVAFCTMGTPVAWTLLQSLVPGSSMSTASGIMNAADPIAMIDEMIAATRRAADDLKKQEG